MRFLHIKLFFVLFFVFNIAQADIYTSFSKVEDYFFDMKGTVIGEDIIDIGADKDLTVGTVLSVYDEGKELLHPMTGKPLGKKRTLLGKLVVKKVYPNYSEVEFLDSLKPQIGNYVSFSFPIGLDYATENRDYARAINNMLQSNSVLTKGNDYNVNFEYVAGRINFQIKQNDGKIIFTGYDTVKLASEVSGELADVTGSFQLANERLFSMGLGKVYKNNLNDFLVVSSENSILILDPFNNYRQIDKINYKFSFIANIEVVDLDDDGQSEIFVTNVREGKKAESVILKHDGGTFRAIKKDIPYLFRSVRTPEGRKVIVQGLSNKGGYIGQMHHYEYRNGSYSIGQAIRGTLGKGIFGFTYSFNDKLDEYMYYNINKSGNLEISTLNKREYISSTYYGDTIHTLSAINRELVINPIDEDVVRVSTEERVHIYPRLEMIDDTKLAIARNDLKSRLFQDSLVFDASFLIIGNYEHGMFKDDFKSKEIQPFISDIFVHENDNREKIVYVLKTTNDWILQKAESRLFVFRVNEILEQ